MNSGYPLLFWGCLWYDFFISPGTWCNGSTRPEKAEVKVQILSVSIFPLQKDPGGMVLPRTELEGVDHAPKKYFIFIKYFNFTLDFKPEWVYSLDGYLVERIVG